MSDLRQILGQLHVICNGHRPRHRRICIIKRQQVRVSRDADGVVSEPPSSTSTYELELEIVSPAVVLVAAVCVITAASGEEHVVCHFKLGRYLSIPVSKSNKIHIAATPI